MTKKEASDPSLRMQVYDQIRIEMDKGNFSPGSFIRLNELSKQMGISKTPLREAMIRLETEGFVTIYPRQGVVVNRFSLEDSRYLFGVIGSLESDMITANFDKFDKAIIEKMQGYCRVMRQALDEDDLTAYDQTHWKYHQVFTDLSDNIFVNRIIAPIKHRLWDCPKRGFSKKWITMACDEHEGIVAALDAKDLEQALFLIRNRHWSYQYNEAYIRKVYFPNGQ
ncbi:MAG: GntR family transcriptional regulator [Desulfobacterales bacterium]|nr:GntR family transcriptional regulator [Desulfobacterales bacterium]